MYKPQAMVEKRMAPVPHYSVSMYISHLKIKEICHSLMLSSLLNHSDGQQPFRMLFACREQYKLRESHVIFGI